MHITVKCKYGVGKNSVRFILFTNAIVFCQFDGIVRCKELYIFSWKQLDDGPIILAFIIIIIIIIIFKTYEPKKTNKEKNI